MIGGNTYILDNEIVLSTSPLNFTGVEVKELDDSESEGRLISVSLDTYDRAGDRSEQAADFERHAELVGHRNFQVFDDDDYVTMPRNTPSVVTVPVNATVNGTPAHHVGEGYYVLKNGTMFRDFEGQTTAEVAPADGSEEFETNIFLINDAAMSAESTKSLREAGGSYVTD
jgi:hypothetical protein